MATITLFLVAVLEWDCNGDEPLDEEYSPVYARCAEFAACSHVEDNDERCTVEDRSVTAVVKDPCSGVVTRYRVSAYTLTHYSADEIT